MHLPQRRRLHHSRILFFLSGVLLCCIYTLTFKARLSEPWLDLHTEKDPGGEEDDDSILKIDTRDLTLSNVTEVDVMSESTQAPLVITVNRTDLKHCIYVDHAPLKPTSAPAPTTPAPTTIPMKPNEPPHRKGEYPEDLFSVEQRKEGWVVLHILGMIYMFVSLAIVCDEFFVPALGVITDSLKISDDVAGATFMAAGGSAPELFTSLIGVFISHSNVGIGTIVGSAVFNILFVIGMCAVFSREMLYLTWWPLFRDVSFYIVDLLMLIVFFLDNTIMWWESMMLVGGYVSYVCFMKFNVQIELAVKTQLNKRMSSVKALEEPEKESGAQPPPPDPQQKQQPKPHNLPPPQAAEDHTKLKVKPVLQRGGSTASLHNSNLRNTIFQLMIHTLDPIGEDTVFRGDIRGPGQRRTRRDTAFNGDVRVEGSVQGRVRKKVKCEELKPQVREKLENTSHCKAEVIDKKPEQANSVSVQVSPVVTPSTSEPAKTEENKQTEQQDKTDQQDKQAHETHSEVVAVCPSGGEDFGGSDEDESSDDEDDDDDDEDEDDSGDQEDEEVAQEEEEEVEEPLSLEWPETRQKQITYLLLLPIVFPLWLTVPDVRNPGSRKYFVITFIGSIMWIAIFSYLMVWWAHQVGETIGISEEIMGLTILAAGTSIPDLITSVIVARKGLGDMAVSSSVGSNIFDITMGLPVPWLMFSIIHGGVPVAVNSNGLFCAIVLLFLMLLFVIISIAACRWKMSRALGFTMFLLYFVFLILSVMLEDRLIVCPISI